ncbi:Metallo-dependent phosphatase-like protein [Dactylonectria estremocensis]|uniref:Metallo-dependent phosphatase-like protein n=1 Tax=Dactylonectria estremocensis TaxID=1079267 RepID=A0A9P9EX12_9HYPO|nr:Metallo-dependent phosphatase-like protein [Dactylonectria estremocensis]
MFRIAARIAFLAGLSLQAATRRATNDSDLAPLKFTEDGTFQICVFSDLHFATDPSGGGPEKDRASVKVINDILGFEQPDLVVLNGDLINGEDTFRENSTHYIDQIVEPMVNRDVPWAAAYGNHDHNYNISAEGIFEREKSFTNSRTLSMISSRDAGVTNYYLPVYASDCDSDDCTPELLLWFFDSRGGSHYQGGGQHNWVHESVVEWFNETNAELVETYDKEIPSLAFVHVPVHVTYLVQQELGINEETNPGINEEDVVQQGDGWCSDGGRNCDYGDQDLPFMRALASIPGIIGLFYGHDHGNSWCYKWDDQVEDMSFSGSGINLCYGQHTGYGGYGDWVRGGRQIFVTQEGLRDLSVDSHIRLENGDVVGEIALNSTFNTDAYASTPNTKTYISDFRSVGSVIAPGAFYTWSVVLSLMTIIISFA